MSGRFFEAFPWRFIVTNLESETLAFLDHLATNRSVVFTRAAATVISGDVPSDSPEVNIASVGGSLLSEGDRFIYGFRREGPPLSPWVVRAAGLVMEVGDACSGDSTPTSGFTAYDPWKYLYRRPVKTAAGTGELPPANGMTYLLSSGDEILIQQLEWAEAGDGPVFLDYGQTAFYTGTIETTTVIGEINFQRGASIGELMDALVATGTMDVKIDPVYDPVNRPGIIGQLSIYDRLGVTRRDVIFGWDEWPRNVVDVSRVRDGLARVNSVLYYAGQGGPPAPLEEDAAAIAKFGLYFEQRFWPGQAKVAAVHEMAVRALALLKQGQFTYTLTPSAERAEVPLRDYHVGDGVMLYATRRLREPIAAALRIESIPIVIGNDQLERVNGLFVSVPEELAA